MISSHLTNFPSTKYKPQTLSTDDAFTVFLPNAETGDAIKNYLQSLHTKPSKFVLYLFIYEVTEVQGRRFESTEGIQAELQDVMKMLTQNDFQQCFRSWKSRWCRCINSEGDYFEGDRGE
jgi:hypothetical protein